MAVTRPEITTLLCTYVIGVLVVRWVVFRAFALNGPAIATIIAVPIVQAGVLAGWRFWFSKRRT